VNVEAITLIGGRKNDQIIRQIGHLTRVTDGAEPVFVNEKAKRGVNCGPHVSYRLTVSLSGRLHQFNSRHERKIAQHAHVAPLT
jgi:hypothetical protein